MDWACSHNPATCFARFASERYSALEVGKESETAEEDEEQQEEEEDSEENAEDDDEEEEEKEAKAGTEMEGPDDGEGERVDEMGPLVIRLTMEGRRDDEEEEEDAGESAEEEEEEEEEEFTQRSAACSSNWAACAKRPLSSNVTAR